MSNSFVESKYFKQDHDKMVEKMEKSLEAIRTRKAKYEDVPSMAARPLRNKNTSREHYINQENKKLYGKLYEVSVGAFSILKDIRKSLDTERGLKPRPNPYRDKENFRIRQQNERLVKVLHEQKMRKKRFF